MSTVRGTVEHIVYRNAQNGYSVIELSRPEGPLTLVGILPELSAGEPIEAEGSFITHPVYGEQLSVSRCTVTMPEDAIAIERYLGSGAIRGIGPALAGRIVRKFGEDTLRILEEEPERLSEIKGISKKGARAITAQVLEKRDLRAAMMYLEKYGISLSLAVKIYERYGQSLYSIIETNPYRLTEDISGVGFRIADDIAMKAGFPEDSDFRLRSGLYYALMRGLDAGHIYLPLSLLKRYAANLLQLENADLDKALMDLALDKRIILRDAADEAHVYAASYYYMEAASAAMLLQLNHPFPLNDEQLENELMQAAESSSIELEEMQKTAVRTAVKQGLTVITGGPGTGKTTTINFLIRYFEAREMSIELAAPTGRAAKRITEATGRPAKTLHRLLEFQGAPSEDGEDTALRFERNESHPLEADVVIVDEVSMVDLPLMYALLKAIIPGTRLILVGDANQLPSVGPGNVLRDILNSGVIPSVTLSRIFRQAETSDIIVNAHKIQRGEIIDTAKRSRDFLFIGLKDAAMVQSAVIGLIRDKLPDYVGADVRELQVISPMRKGVLGVENLNRVLQEALNPPAQNKKERLFPQGLLRQGDKVMQIKNNYQKDWEIRGGNVPLRRGTGIFNGDIGVILDIHLFTEELVVLFDESREVVYAFNEVNELELAYAVTVHKSQGSEYPAVVLPLLSGPAPLMTRNLIYTAVTRARACVCVVGSPEVFQQMVDNDTEQKRYSSLDRQLIELSEREDHPF